MLLLENNSIWKAILITFHHHTPSFITFLDLLEKLSYFPTSETSLSLSLTLLSSLSSLSDCASLMIVFFLTSFTDCVCLFSHRPCCPLHLTFHSETGFRTVLYRSSMQYRFLLTSARSVSLRLAAVSPALHLKCQGHNGRLEYALALDT